MMTASEGDVAKSLPHELSPQEEAEFERLEREFAQGCGDAMIVVANRTVSGKPCDMSYLDALLDVGEQQSASRDIYWAGFCVLVRVMQGRLRQGQP